MINLKDLFRMHPLKVEGPAVASFEIAPSDSADLPQPIRAITLATAGKVSWISTRNRDGAIIEVTATLPAGTYPIFARRIRNTGTTATGLTGWI